MQFAPAATHTCFAPTPRTLEQLPPADLLVAWSLGAWRVLEAASRGVPLPRRVILLAPFVAFASEYQLGGRCSATQVRFLSRWVQRDPLAALKDFHFRADLGPPPSALPYEAADLLEGLERLGEDAPPEMRRFAAAGLPSGWTAIVGANDPLLDAPVVCASLPGTTIAPNARHGVAALLAAIQTPIHAL